MGCRIARHPPFRNFFIERPLASLMLFYKGITKNERGAVRFLFRNLFTMSAAFGPHSSSGFILRPVALPPVWYHPEPTLIRLCDALGAELQEDVFAPNDVPSYDLALRDGWAVNASETGHRKVLNDVVENGRTPPDLPPMSAIWVNTGGPIPKGVTAIIPSAARSDLADAQKAAEPENGIMRRGAEWCVGDLLLKSGVRIGAAETALLFEAGMDVVKARSLASVGIIATGSELRDFVCRAEGPTRVSSDAAYLRSLLLDAGIRDVWARSAADDSEAIAAALTGLAVRSDVLITIGGTGRGSKDLTRRAILEAGGKLLDSQEADRCSGGASPFIAGELDGRPVIGLPGNPLAAMMIAQRVVLPLIAARSGIALHEKVVRAAFSGNIPAGKTGELCVSLCGCGDARIARAVQKGTGSVLLLRDAAGVVKVGKDGIKAGDEVDVICFIN